MPTPTTRPTIRAGAHSWMVSQMASRPTSRTSAPLISTSLESLQNSPDANTANLVRSWLTNGYGPGRSCLESRLLFQRSGGFRGRRLLLVSIDAVVGGLHGLHGDLADQRLQRLDQPLVARPLRRDQHHGVIGRDRA